MDVDGKDIEWCFKACGQDMTEQMTLYAPGRADNDKVMANVWNWGSGWSAPEWYENGVKVSDMTLEPRTDPDYVDLYAGFTHKTNRKYCVPTEDVYMFTATPTEGCRGGEVRVRDKFGREFSAQINW